jgi:hypothetical protein
MTGKPWPVLVQVNATSLVDEGPSNVFDILQEKATATGVLVAAHGFNPEVVDRGKTWPGHGPRGSNGSLGGYFATVHEQYYRGTSLGSPRVRDAAFEGFDVMEAAGRETKARGLSLHVYILESAGTGGFQRRVSGWPAVLEIDVDGRRSRLPCVNHPDYRAWKLAILEDLYSSYSFDGLLWGVERWGPLHQVLAGETPCCFCEHCGKLAREAGLNWRAVKAGYAAFRDAVHRNRAAQGRGENLLRLFLAHPEITGGEARWTQAYLTLHRELYGAAKWMQPDRAFGLGLWHYYFIDPLLQTEWNLAEFSVASDYIRPILYHLPEGPRIKRHLGNLTAAFASLSEETLWAFISELLGLQLPPLEHFATTGLPAAYVTQGIDTVRRNSRPGTTIYAGLGIDVFEDGLGRSMTPEDAEAAVHAAHAAKADGITISRNYAEMQHGNLEAIGRAVRALASSCADGLASQSAQGSA